MGTAVSKAFENATGDHNIPKDSIQIFETGNLNLRIKLSLELKFPT